MPRIVLLLIVALAALLGATMPSWAAKRALIVGINDYRGGQEATGGRWRDLRGAVNDAEAMRTLLVSRFGFERDEVLVLLDGEATREGILDSIDQHLIQKSKSGDTVLFHFAGHGSQLRNPKGKELDAMDETIVPADSYLGASDIRDKELRTRFNDVLDRGADLVAVFDSCSSGSILRSIEAARYLPPGSSSAPALEPEKRAPPEERGALLLSAASTGLPAAEARDDQGRPRGAFSYQLVKAMREASPDEPAEQIFLRVRAALMADAKGQAPVLAGTKERRSLPLLGGAPSEASDTYVAVVRKLPDGRIELDGGSASGLNVGAELNAKQIGSTLKLRVVEVPGVARSYARVSKGDPSTLGAGALFRLDRWSPAKGAALRVSFPTAASEAQFDLLLEVARALHEQGSAQGVEWIGDPTTGRPTHRMFWTASGWTLQSSQGLRALGNLKLEDVAATVAALPQGSALWVDLPPSSAMRAELAARIEASAGAIEAVGEDEAHYQLTTTLHDDAARVAWIQPHTLVKRPGGGLPARSDWASTQAEGAKQLRASLDVLLRIRSWLMLSAPPDQGRFPYRLVLRRESNGKRVPGGAVREGERYRISLEAAKIGPRSSIEPRYVYVFAIDGFGRQALVFPSADGGNAENQMPPRGMLGAPAPAVVPVGSIQISPPFGHETLVMVSTAIPLADPGVLEGRGVRTRSAGSALDEFLGWVGNVAATPNTSTSTSWGIDRLSLVSLPQQGD